MRSKLWVVLVSIIFTGNTALAQDRPLITRDKIVFQDWYNEVRNISNHNLIVGVHSGNLEKQLDKNILTLNGLKKDDSHICISLEYISGTYLALATISNPPKSGAVDIDLPIEDFIKQFNFPLWDEIATAARVVESDDCSMAHITSNVYLLPSWEASNSNSVRFIINPDVGSIVKLVVEGESNLCVDLDSRRKLSSKRTIQDYSMVCDASLPNTCRSEVKFELIVTAFGQRQPGVSGTLRRACPLSTP